MKTILKMLRQHAIRNPSAIALDSAEFQLTYARLLEEVEFASAQLKANQVQVLGIDLDNGFDWIITDLGAAMAEIPVVPLPWFFSAGQRLHALQDSGIDFVVASTSSLKDLEQHSSSMNFAIGSYLIAIEKPANENERFPADTGKISYTSGSTGTPRGVALNSSFIDATANAVKTIVEDLGIENHLSLLPYSTLLENLAGVYVPILLGKTICSESSKTIGLDLNLGIDPKSLHRVFQQTKPNSLIVTPGLLELLCDLTERGVIHTGSLRFVAVGGARVGDSLIYRARNNGIPAYEGYGLTEFGSVACLNTPRQDRVGSVGKPLPGVSVIIAKDNEIHLCRNLEISCDPQQTTVQTGDYGSLDSDGFLYVHGRKCNQITLSNGRNLAPEWIETELNTSALIQQSFVYSEDSHDVSACLYCSRKFNDIQIEIEVMRVNSRLPAYARIKKWHRLIEPFSSTNQTLTTNGRLRRSQIMHALPNLVSASKNSLPKEGRHSTHL